MIYDSEKETLATVETVITVVAKLADNIHRGEPVAGDGEAATRHKVAASIMKQLSRHMTTEE